jgi:hypothetical protein
LVITSPGSMPARSAGESPEYTDLHAGDLSQAGDRRVLRRDLADRHADHRAADLAMRDQVVHHLLGQRDRDREAVTRVEAGLAGDRRVDADDLAPRIHERPTRVARVDRSVGLDEVGNVVVRAREPGEAAPLGAHYAGRDGEVEAERVADGQHPFTDAHLLVVAEGDGGEVAPLDLEHGDVGGRVAADDLRVEHAAVLHRDLHPVGAFDDVVVREDVAVARDDEARAARLLRARLLRVLVAELAEELLEARRH